MTGTGPPVGDQDRWSTLSGVLHPPPLRPRDVTPRPLSEVAALLRTSAPAGASAVTGVTHDSRTVQPGDLYAALPGANVHGARFAADAVRDGAVAVLTDPAGAALAGVSGEAPVLVVPDPRSRLGDVASLVYGHPSRDLLMLGVTGTNGKTTTAYLADAGLRAAGRITGLVGTVETRIGDHRAASVRTTPEATDLHALLAVMREEGVSACVMEVSSHALVLGRVDGIVFDVAGFTNLSRDHLDFHADLEDYFRAKAALFTAERARRGVVCVDDPYGRRLARDAGIPVVTLATGAGDRPDWWVGRREVSESGASTRVILEHRSGRGLSVSSPIPGEFNVANAALATVLLVEAGVDADLAASGVAACPGVPGRMERVAPVRSGDPLGVVDYAHTPEAVENALRALRPSTAGRLIVVLGAGGDRDRDKRALMGAAAARAADLAIVTDDNPRSEDPAAIRAEIMRGAVAAGSAEVREVGDRRAAIMAAVDAAGGAADTVVVVGKGHEQGQEVSGVVHPFDDRVVLREAMERRNGEQASREDTT